MKLNITTKIEGDKVILVPYREYHVLKYHKWMSDTELQELTASEPLTLDEEYEMQKTWQIDENKLTFIVLNKSIYYSSNSGNDDNKAREIEAMIGDVNAFIVFDHEACDDDDDDDDNDEATKKDAISQAENTINKIEIDIMISEREHRGRGLGIEAVYLMMYYCLLNFSHLNTFIAKINEDNQASIKMFNKLNFTQFEYLSVFKQVCMKFVVNESSSSVDENIDNIARIRLSSIKNFENLKININLNYA